MHLYLIQHGEARTSEEDPERPPTDAGAANAKKTAAFFVIYIEARTHDRIAFFFI